MNRSNSYIEVVKCYRDLIKYNPDLPELLVNKTPIGMAVAHWKLLKSVGVELTPTDDPLKVLADYCRRTDMKPENIVLLIDINKAKIKIADKLKITKGAVLKCVKKFLSL